MCITGAAAACHMVDIVLVLCIRKLVKPYSRSDGVRAHAHNAYTAQIGDTVAPGDVYCEVETDKATIAWESQEEGFIAQVGRVVSGF